MRGAPPMLLRAFHGGQSKLQNATHAHRRHDVKVGVFPPACDNLLRKSFKFRLCGQWPGNPGVH